MPSIHFDLKNLYTVGGGQTPSYNLPPLGRYTPLHCAHCESWIRPRVNIKKEMLKGPIPSILVVHLNQKPMIGLPRTHFHCIPTWVACSSG